jgi:hypothetical protein
MMQVLLHILVNRSFKIAKLLLMSAEYDSTESL